VSFQENIEEEMKKSSQGWWEEEKGGETELRMLSFYRIR